MPAATASSIAYWITGLSTSGSISFGWALVAGRRRVPQPAAGKTALRTRMEPRTARPWAVAARARAPGPTGPAQYTKAGCGGRATLPACLPASVQPGGDAAAGRAAPRSGDGARRLVRLGR